jgi:hypothetical protein
MSDNSHAEIRPALFDFLETKLLSLINGGYIFTSGLVHSCWNKILGRFFGPREILDRHLLGISYYYQGAWHLALIKHVNKRSRVISAKGHYDLVDRDPITMDITNVVKLILGPAEDCHGQDVYPKDMGFTSISLEVLMDDYTANKTIIVGEDEGITKKLNEGADLQGAGTAPLTPR